MFEDKDDTILARWLAGKLTDEERTEFEQSPEFGEYEQIARGMERFKKPDFDKEVLRNKVMDALERPNKGKVIHLKSLFYAVAVAASVLLVIGLFFNEVTYTAPIGKQLAFELPDGSEILLNAKSQLTHQRFFWKNNKVVHLSGEGFFKIEKGDGFSVQTLSGTVSVLGTQFNIKARNTIFELACYEGKVQFNAAKGNENAILTKGDAIKLIEGDIKKETILQEAPTWINGKSTFTYALLNEVIQELEIQYGITVQNNLEANTDHFTGSFVHDNLEIALKTVFTPMGIAYELSNDQKTVILKAP